MLNPDDIHEKASEERRRQALQEAKKQKGKKEKPFDSHAADSRFVFHRIYPYQPNFFIWIFVPLALAITGFVMWFTDQKKFAFLLPYAFAALAIPLLVRLYYLIREQLDYRQYRNWRSELGFTLNGWDRLGQNPFFPHWKHWDREVTVDLRLKEGINPATIKLAADLLFLFTAKANRVFYTADFLQPGAAGDIRHRWKTVAELSATGSANSQVMGQVYLFIHKQLRVFQKQTNALVSVQIGYSKSMIEVEPERSSD